MADTAQLPTLDEVADGFASAGYSPADQAGAILKWRDAAREAATSALGDSPTQLFQLGTNLDTAVADKVKTLQSQDVAAWQVKNFGQDQQGYDAFAGALKQGGLPAAAQINPDAAKSYAGILANPAFRTPATDSPYVPLTGADGSPFGSYKVQQGTAGRTDVLISIQPKSKQFVDTEGDNTIHTTQPDMVHGMISVPTVTDEDVQKARDEALKQQRQAKVYSAADGSGDPEAAFSASISRPSFDNQARDAALRAQQLSGPNGKQILQSEAIQKAFKDSPLASKAGEFNLGGDLLRGLTSVELGINYAIQSTTGDAAAEKQARDALAALPEAIPGTTRPTAGAQFLRSTGEFGGQLPMLVNPAGVAVLAASTYGGKKAEALDAADAADKQADSLEKGSLPSGKPSNLTDQFNTKLSPEDEAKFQQWAQQTGRTKDLYDYDMRGWWRENGQEDSRGHFTDQFKKPNHPTFSNESQYSTKENPGGVWSTDASGKDVFTASPANFKFQSPEELQNYFKRVEPDGSVVLPKSPGANPALAQQFRDLATRTRHDATAYGALSAATMAGMGRLIPEAQTYWGGVARAGGEFGGINAVQGQVLDPAGIGKRGDGMDILEGVLVGGLTGAVHGAGREFPEKVQVQPKGAGDAGQGAPPAAPQPSAPPADIVLAPGIKKPTETPVGASQAPPAPSPVAATPPNAPEAAPVSPAAQPAPVPTAEQIRNGLRDLRIENLSPENPTPETAATVDKIHSIQAAKDVAIAQNDPATAEVLQKVEEVAHTKLATETLRTQPEPIEPKPNEQPNVNANDAQQANVNPDEVTPSTQTNENQTAAESPETAAVFSVGPKDAEGNFPVLNPAGKSVSRSSDPIEAKRIADSLNEREQRMRRESASTSTPAEPIPPAPGGSAPAVAESQPSPEQSTTQGDLGNTGGSSSGSSGAGDSTTNANRKPPIDPAEEIRLAHADEDAQRAAAGLPPIAHGGQATDAQLKAQALQRLANNEAPGVLERAAKTGRLSDEDHALMVAYAGALDRSIKDNAAKIADPNSTPEQRAQATGDYALAEQEREKLSVTAALAGSKAGSDLRARKLAIDRDAVPSLAQMVADLMIFKGKKTGDPFADITPEERAHLTEVHDQMQSTQDAIDRVKADASVKAADDQNAKLIAELQNELAETKKQLEQSQKTTAEGTAKKPRFTKRVVDAISVKADAARERLKARGVQFNSGVDPSSIPDYALIMAEYIAKGVDAAAEMVSKFGDTIKDSLKDIEEAARGFLTSEIKAKTADELKSGLRDRKATDPEATIGKNFLREIAKAHIREALQKDERLTARQLDLKVWQDAKEFEPDITLTEARDLRTGYGTTSLPSDDPTEVELRDLNRQAQLLSSIERAEKGLAALKSGPQRDKASAAVRLLQKQLNAEMSKHDNLTNSPASLASRRDGIVSRLKNEIEDLDNQIAGIQKADPKLRPVDNDEELQRLRTHRDKLKKIVAEMPENKAATERDKNEAAINAAQKAEKEWTRRADELDFSSRGKPTPEQSAEVRDARTKADEARKRYLDLKKTELANQPGDYFREISAKVKASDERIAELENKLAREDTSKQEAKPGQSHPLLDKNRKRIAELNKQVDDLRRAQEAPNLEADRLQNQLDDAHTKVIELEQRLMYGDLDKRPSVKKDVEARLQSLREQAKGLNKQVAKARSERERPQREAEAAARELQQAKDDNADLEKRLLSGDLFKKKEQQRAVSKELATERERRKELNKQLAEARKQASLAYRPDLPPKPTTEESRRKAYKTRIENRTAELRMRRIAQNYETPKRSDALNKSDKEIKDLSLKLKKEQNAYDFEKRQRELDAQPWYQKLGRLPARAKRGLALISAPIYLKLALAGNVARPFMTLMEETLGRGALRTFMPDVMKESPGEGGASGISAISDYAKGWARGWTEMKHAEFTGATRNQLLYGSKGEKFTKPKWEDYLTTHPHSAIKAPAWEAAFSVSEGNRISHAGYASAESVPADKLLEIRQAAAKDADHAIYLNDNAINKAYSAALGGISNSGPVGDALAEALRFNNIIVKIPTNLVGEATKYLLGTVIAPVQKTILKAKQGGALTPEQADSIARTFKKGSAFAGLVAIAYLAPNAIKVGGQYVQGERRKKDDAKPGDVTLFGYELPHAATHAGVFTAAQALGTGIRDLVKNGSITHSAAQVIMGLAEDVPMVRGTGEFLSNIGAGKEKEDARSRALKGLIPAPVRAAAEQQDYRGEHSLPYRIFVDPDRSNVINRGAGFQSGVPDIGIPGLPSRQDLPVKRK